MRPALHECFKRFKELQCKGAEIGIEHGENAFVILREWLLSNGREIFLYLVDIDAKCEKIATERLGTRDTYKIIIGDSKEVAKQFADGFFDWVYVDDNHEYEGARSSLEAWYPKVKDGGILCGHDFNMEQVEDAVRGFFARNKMELHTEEIDWWGVKCQA